MMLYLHITTDDPTMLSYITTPLKTLSYFSDLAQAACSHIRYPAKDLFRRPSFTLGREVIMFITTSL